MSKMENILRYVDNYKKYGNDKFYNYYEIFELSRDDSIEKLNKSAKGLKKMFHPDGIGYVPNEIKTCYSKIFDIILNMENDFRDNVRKSRYDSNLDKFIKEEEILKLKDTFEGNVKLFNFAISENIVKHGFLFTFVAIKELVWNNWYNGFTKEFSVRDKIVELGKDKVIDILKTFKKYEKAQFEEVVINYFTELVRQDERLLNKLKFYVRGMEETLRKYDRNYVYSAIKRLGSRKNYNDFSNNMNARTNMEQNVNYRDYLVLILIYFEYFKDKDGSLGYREVMNMNEEQVIKKFILDLEKNMYQVSNKRARR